jgi:hypothetical protein
VREEAKAKARAAAEAEGRERGRARAKAEAVRVVRAERAALAAKQTRENGARALCERRAARVLLGAARSYVLRLRVVTEERNRERDRERARACAARAAAARMIVGSGEQWAAPRGPGPGRRPRGSVVRLMAGLDPSMSTRRPRARYPAAPRGVQHALPPIAAHHLPTCLTPPCGRDKAPWLPLGADVPWSYYVQTPSPRRPVAAHLVRSPRAPHTF